MAKLAVITEPSLAAGFSLAGVDVYGAPSPAEAKRILLALMSEPEVGIIAIHAGYLSALDEATRRRASESAKPVVVAVPSGVPTEGGERLSHAIAEMIRRAIGFRITFRGG
jgi:V/A-type H+/Na+-transporting ATPase subunit F